MLLSRLCVFLVVALRGLPLSLCSNDESAPQDISIPSDASSSSSSTASGPKKTHVLPLIPHHEQRRRMLEEESSGRRLEADQIAALYHGFGTHYIDLWCGTPPQRQTVIVDTGSGVTAFPCSGCKDCGAPKYHIDGYFVEADSSTFEKVACDSCQRGTCKQGEDRCDISMSYQEGSSWHAYEAIDSCYVGGPHNAPLVQVDADTSDWNPNHASAFSTRLTFGCQDRLTGLFKTQLADGIMGMEGAATSYWKQLYKNGQIETQQFALCFSRPTETSREGTVAGAMTLGGVDPRLDDTPLVYSTGASGRGGFFGVKVRHIYLRTGHDGNDSAKYTDIKTENLDVPTGSFIVDSGTTDTYLNKRISKSFRAAFKTLSGKDYDHKGMTLTDEELSKLPTILFQFEGDDIQNADLPDDTVGLAGALDSEHPLDVILALPPSHYMELDSKGKYVARFYDDEGGGSVIGANAMMGHNVFFDMESKRIGWAESKCDYTELLSESGYPSVLTGDGTPSGGSSGGSSVESSSNSSDDTTEDPKKEKPSGSDHDKATPPEDMAQALGYLADSCDSFVCRGGAMGTLIALLLSCICCMRRCCCPKKYSKPAYQRTEVEMNGISTSYRDEEGFKDEPDEDDEEYGEFNP